MKERDRDKDKEREQEEEGREVYGRGSPVSFHLQFELALTILPVSLKCSVPATM